MPVAFLTEGQRATYGRYAGEPADEQLARFFHLEDEDKALIDGRRADHLREVRALGVGSLDLSEVPPGRVAALALMVAIPILLYLSFRRSGWL